MRQQWRYDISGISIEMELSEYDRPIKVPTAYRTILFVVAEFERANGLLEWSIEDSGISSKLPAEQDELTEAKQLYDRALAQQTDAYQMIREMEATPEVYATQSRPLPPTFRRYDLAQRLPFDEISFMWRSVVMYVIQQRHRPQRVIRAASALLNYAREFHSQNESKYVDVVFVSLNVALTAGLDHVQIAFNELQSQIMTIMTLHDHSKINNNNNNNNNFNINQEYIDDNNHYYNIERYRLITSHLVNLLDFVCGFVSVSDTISVYNCRVLQYTQGWSTAAILYHMSFYALRPHRCAIVNNHNETCPCTFWYYARSLCAAFAFQILKTFNVGYARSGTESIYVLAFVQHPRYYRLLTTMPEVLRPAHVAEVEGADDAACFQHEGTDDYHVPPLRYRRFIEPRHVAYVKSLVDNGRIGQCFFSKEHVRFHLEESDRWWKQQHEKKALNAITI